MKDTSLWDSSIISELAIQYIETEFEPENSAYRFNNIVDKLTIIDNQFMVSGCT